MRLATNKGLAVSRGLSMLSLRILSTLQAQYPSLLEHFAQFEERAEGKRVAVFLDYDGEPATLGSENLIL